MIQAQSDVYTSGKTTAVLFGVVGGIGNFSVKEEGIGPSRKRELS